jgi:phosphoribosylformylglycinamidine (FGAM) synthase-like enzyme
LMEDAEYTVASAFRVAGDAIVLLDGALDADRNVAETVNAFSSSEYAKEIHGIVAGAPPAIDLGAEKRLIGCMVKLAADKAITSAHDVSDGGIAVTLAESTFGYGLGASVKLPAVHGLDAEAAVFGERGARAVVSAPAGSLARVKAIAAQCGVSALEIGNVATGDFRIQYGDAAVVQGPVTSFRKPWSESLLKAVELG